MAQRKFYRNVFTVEVLSEDEPVDTLSLETLHDLITFGGCSGRMLETTHESIDGPTTARLLQEQGSDPEFFRLDENGNDLEVD